MKVALPSAPRLPSSTAAGSPSRSCSFTAASCNALDSTPSSSATSTLAPLGADTAWAARACDLATASCAFRPSTSLDAALSSDCRAATRPGTSSGLTLSAPAAPLTMESSAFMCSTAAGPATASMRLMPDAMPLSLSTLKDPISDVLRTWVPPHSSMDTPGTSTTRTTSSYFSPNMAVAPAALASSRAMTCVLRGVASDTQMLMRRSTSDTSEGVMGRGRLKSNLSLSNVTSEPCWQVSGPSTRLRADWSRWVAVWCALMRRRSTGSTSAVTCCPTRRDPACTSAVCTNNAPPAAFLTSPTSSSVSASPTTRIRPWSPTWPPDSA
mmetsp:Transcript_40443/g.89848  ORF Transcript_40443/g.89848 Transcript_40443/m.89848 type:complete len:325 (-) Transcript_40443:1353-2327(-)